MKRWRRQLAISMCLVFLLPAGATSAPEDPTMTSSGYRVTESEVGGDGSFDSDSAGYSIDPNIDDGGTSLGDTGVGNSSSAGYQTNSGFNTTAQPGLTFIVNSSSVDLGNLSTSAANTATATFSVLNYTSYGYVVTVIGTPPSYGGNPLNALATDSASVTGTEQFGINLRANTSPVSVGTDPAQDPDGTFSFGVAGDGVTGTYGTTRPYTIPNNYRFVSGETVASAPKSSGKTNFTISFMSNISTVTPGGRHSGSLTLVATGTY